MNDQQRAAMIRPRGKSEAPHMIAAYRAMQMALEALHNTSNALLFVSADGYSVSKMAADAYDDAEKAITALREAVENNELSDVTLINEGDMAQPQETDAGDHWWVAELGTITGRNGLTTNDQYRAVRAAIRYFHESQPQDHSEQHLNMVQGEWVDLTDDEKYDLWCEFHNSESKPIKRGYDDCIIAKFKEKNTLFRLQQQSETIVRDLRSEQPPVVPQGEPVAWYYKQTHVYLQNACDAVYIERVVDKPKSWEEHPLYFTPPSVEAMRIETLEKAAKVCEGFTADMRHQSKEAYSFALNCAAAIRSMK